MDSFQALILGILQGITEFLPISSSGHLVLGEHYLGLDAAYLKDFDVAVHIGTLFAIIVYFWKDITAMLKAFFKFCAGKLKKDDPYGQLIVMVVIGTLPILVGPFIEDFIDGNFRDVWWVGFWMIVIGCVFVLGEFVGKRVKKSELSWRKALVIGCAQLFALIPGVSRSGSTIVAGLFQGIERERAARFSFLLGIPALVGAGLFTALGEGSGAQIGLDVIVVGLLASFVSGLVSVYFLMKFLKKNSLLVFAVYLVAVGIFVIL